MREVVVTFVSPVRIGAVPSFVAGTYSVTVFSCMTSIDAIARRSSGARSRNGR
jgi:hypothetical protein